MADPSTPRPTQPDSVRLPADLREYLKQKAVDNHRTFSGEIAHRLELSRRAESARDAQPPVPSG